MGTHNRLRKDFVLGTLGKILISLSLIIVLAHAAGVQGLIQANEINAANPVINNSPIALGSWRVGDALPTAFVYVTNQAITPPQAALNASISGNAPITASGSFNLLNPGGTNNNTLQVGMTTGVAGAINGTATIAFVSDASNVGGCAPNCQLNLPSQNVAVIVNVYTPAVGMLNTSGRDFGIVHKGEIVNPFALSVKNDAAVTALNDVLQGSFSGAPAAPFTASGNLGAGLAAGVTDNTSLKVALDTSNAGIYNGSANLNFSSRNTEMADLPLGIVGISLFAQVNNFANPMFVKMGGEGILKQENPYEFLFDFGQLSIGSGLSQASLGVINDTSGPADLLRGAFDLNAPNFVLSGFDSFDGIAAGDLFGGLNIGFNANALGDYSGLITIRSIGYNPSGYEGDLPVIALNLQAEVVSGQPIPEPGTILLLGSGLIGLAGYGRKKLIKK